MGYTTYFEGQFDITPKMKKKHIEYINAFSSTRRMRRDSTLAETRPDPKRIAVGLPIGIEGEYFVGGMGFFGQDHDVLDSGYNYPPISQPGLWCQWVVTSDGNHLEWDGGEKFYEYEAWLEYIIEHFLKPWGYKLNGEVEWHGEDTEDIGKISVTKNSVKVLEGSVTYKERV